MFDMVLNTPLDFTVKRNGYYDTMTKFGSYVLHIQEAFITKWANVN